MFFDIEDIFIAKIYSMVDFNPEYVSEQYAAFYKTIDENENDIYILLNRGKINHVHFKHGTIFQSIDDIDIPSNEEISFFFIDNIKPIVKKLNITEIKPVLNLFQIFYYLSQINKREKQNALQLNKIKKKSKNRKSSME